MQKLRSNSKINLNRVIFGCGRLRGGGEKANSIKIIREAFSLGISDFDIAPCYGYGDVEDLLVEALGDKIQEIRVTTKIGLSRGTAPSSSVQVIKPILRKLICKFPLLKNMFTNKHPITSSIGNMNLEFLKTSFEETLKKLNVNKVSTLLLHEPPDGFNSHIIINYLDSLKSEGVVEKYGTGTGDCFGRVQRVGEVLQFRLGDDIPFHKLKNYDVRIHGFFRSNISKASCDVVLGSIADVLGNNDNVKIVFSTTSLCNLKIVANYINGIGGCNSH